MTELIGSEGTLNTGIYDKSLDEESGITVYKPVTEEYKELRTFIESIKQKEITDTILKAYMDFCNRLADRHHTQNIILGCTEFPILVKEIEKNNQFFREYSKEYFQIRFWAPLECVLEFLKAHLK